MEPISGLDQPFIFFPASHCTKTHWIPHTHYVCMCAWLLSQLSESFGFTLFDPLHPTFQLLFAPSSERRRYQETAECIKLFFSASLERKELLHSQVQKRGSSRFLLDRLIAWRWFICTWTGFLRVSQQVSAFLNCSARKMIARSLGLLLHWIWFERKMQNSRKIQPLSLFW